MLNENSCFITRIGGVISHLNRVFIRMRTRTTVGGRDL